MSLGWTDERVEKLLALWQEGHSASHISARLGITRNAVIGKLHRMGKSERSAGPRVDKVQQASKPASPKSSKTIAHVPARAMERQPASTIVAPAPAPGVDERVSEIPSERVSLIDLRVEHCRWPFGSPGQDGFGFCGARREDIHNEHNFYCPHHSTLAYAPSKERKPVSAETKEKMRAAAAKSFEGFLRKEARG
jgi:GcrA cell cycle regulator